jgi:hypothetical protein
MFADNRLVVSREIKIFIETEVVEQKEQTATTSAAGTSTSV